MDNRLFGLSAHYRIIFFCSLLILVGGLKKVTRVKGV